MKEPKLREGREIKVGIFGYSLLAKRFEKLGFHFGTVWKKHWHPGKPSLLPFPAQLSLGWKFSSKTKTPQSLTVTSFG